MSDKKNILKETSNNIKLVIFDLDGTLVDAYPAIIKSFNFVMNKLSYNPKSPVVIRKAVGWGDKKLLEPFIKRNDLKYALDCYRKHHAKALTQYASVKNSTVEMLKELKYRGLKLAVASNRPKKFSKILLKALNIEDIFDYLLFGDEIEKAKPAPDMLNIILKYFKYSKEQAIYVGDMIIDVIAGRRAGIKTVIVLGGSSSYSEINQERPGYIIKNIKELSKIIK